MKYIIICEGIAGSPRSIEVGLFLQAFDPEARGGRGDVTWTPHIENALRFDTAIEAAEFWKTQSKTMPLRPDGLPNRPLTAYSVSIVPVERGVREVAFDIVPISRN